MTLLSYFFRILWIFLSLSISSAAVWSVFYLPSPQLPSNNNVLQLVNSGGMPAIDSLGDTVSYISLNDGYSEIWLIRSDGRENRLLTPIKGNISKMKWSPNGLVIAFIANQGSDKIFRISKYGGVITPVSRAFDAIEQFVWLDDEWILHDGYENGKWGVYLSKTDRVYVRLSSFDIDAKHPNLLKEGSLVAMSAKYSEGYKIILYNLTSGSWTPITFGSGDDLKPAFSPDGKKIAYLSNRAGRWSIWLKNIDTDSEIDLTAPFSERRYPSWAPDVDLNTTLIWKPDSQHLIFDGKRGNSREIYIINLSGGTVTLRFAVKEYFPLTLNVIFESVSSYNPVIDPRGESIYFENRGEGASSVWRLDLNVKRALSYG